MKIFTGFIIILTIKSYAALHKDLLPISKPCHQGDIIENECNTCICTPEHIFECNSKPCNITDISDSKKGVSCHAGMIYIRNKTVCLCKADGSWPHDKCEKILNSFPNKPSDNCKPDSYIIVDCNVCKCGPDGKLDQKHCTRNECNPKEIKKTRRYVKPKLVYGTCEAKNWYSLSPCQFCYCVSENKLICNTGNDYSKDLQLVSYNLSYCGKDLFKEVISIASENENVLRQKNKQEDVIELTNTKKKPTYHESTEVKHETNEKSIERDRQQQISVKDEYRDYYSESEESEVPIPIGKVLSTKFPDKDGNREKFDNRKGVSKPSSMSLPAPVIERYSEQFAGSKSKKGQLPGDSFNLGDVLKPYLPKVMNKVFRMALRKSMVSVVPHANCTPGAKTMVKCNSCFCLKNNKLLCTDYKC